MAQDDDGKKAEEIAASIHQGGDQGEAAGSVAGEGAGMAAKEGVGGATDDTLGNAAGESVESGVTNAGKAGGAAVSTSEEVSKDPSLALARTDRPNKGSNAAEKDAAAEAAEEELTESVDNTSKTVYNSSKNAAIDEGTGSSMTGGMGGEMDGLTGGDDSGLSSLSSLGGSDSGGGDLDLSSVTNMTGGGSGDATDSAKKSLDADSLEDSGALSELSDSTGGMLGNGSDGTLGAVSKEEGKIADQTGVGEVIDGASESMAGSGMGSGLGG